MSVDVLAAFLDRDRALDHSMKVIPISKSPT